MAPPNFSGIIYSIKCKEFDHKKLVSYEHTFWETWLCNSTVIFNVILSGEANSVGVEKKNFNSSNFKPCYSISRSKEIQFVAFHHFEFA